MLLPLECEPNWYVVIHSVPLHFTLTALYTSQSSSLQVLQQITLGVSDGSFHTLEYLNYLRSSYFERQLPGETVLNFHSRSHERKTTTYQLQTTSLDSANKVVTFRTLILRFLTFCEIVVGAARDYVIQRPNPLDQGTVRI